MSRNVLRLILDVVGTILIALLLLGGWFTFLSERADDGFSEAFRVLFNFMDVGLAVWLVLLIVFTVRAKATGVSAKRTYLLLAVGAILNLLVVITVGFVQGGWAPLLVVFAVEAGIACLVSAAIVVPIVHRVVRGGRVPE